MGKEGRKVSALLTHDTNNNKLKQKYMQMRKSLKLMDGVLVDGALAVASRET